MGALNKLRNRSRISKGRAKQTVGRATNNRRLQAEGLADRMQGGAGQVGEQVKDTGKSIRRAFGR